MIENYIQRWTRDCEDFSLKDYLLYADSFSTESFKCGVKTVEIIETDACFSNI